jgi:hypothetical protein
MELASDGTGAGAQYLERAGARAAARLTMKVEERSGHAPGTEEQVKSRLIAAFPEARVVPADLLRLTVPVRVTRGSDCP